MMDGSHLRLHQAKEGELAAFCSIYDIGKYFKRIDRSGPSPRFTMAEDRKKLYPDD